MGASSLTNSLDGIASTEYMKFCQPITASCVNDGIPMVGMFRGKILKGFACGHCGLSITKNNELRMNMSRINLV